MPKKEARFVFSGSNQYAFVFHNAHLLLLSYDRDDAKFLFLIEGEEDGVLQLAYPGRTFTDRVLDTVEPIFFVQMEEEGETPKRYVLGSLFEAAGRTYGAYYERDEENPQVVLLEVSGEAPDITLSVPDAAAYAAAIDAFTLQHQQLGFSVSQD